MRNIYSVPLLVILLIITGSFKSEAKNLSSPNGKIEVVMNIDKSDNDSYGSASITVKYRDDSINKTVIDKLILGLKTDMQNLGDSLNLISVSDNKEIIDDYIMITGKKSHCLNYATERIYTFENPKKEKIDVIIRAYNDGVVFRYKLSSLAEGENLTEEITTFPLETGVKRWVQPYVIDNEGFYTPTLDGSIDEKNGRNRHPNEWAYPILVENDKSLYMMITEANISYGQSASRIINKEDNNKYQIKIADAKVPISGTWISPWRLLIIGSLADIVESTLVTDVSEPSKVTDTSWIVPGPASWIYWAYNNGSNNFQLVKEYVDLAVEMNWPYNLIDWKWNEMGNGGNVDDALKYADEKGVKSMLWYNSSTSWNGEGAPGPLYVLNEKESRVNEYKMLHDKGVAGIKVDFFNGDGHEEMNYYIDLLEDAIDYKLMLNFHGAAIPRGWQRTYPHMMTVEAVYGAEWYNNLPLLTNRAAKHNATLPFTRNVIGSMDYTPGTFTDSQHPHITSHGHELALTVIFESAIQHMPDRPESYLTLPSPVKEFLSKLPTAWDETKLLDGYPGDYVVLARRKGTTWYIGGLNGEESPQTLSFDVSELVSTFNKISIIKDGAEERSFDFENITDISGIDQPLEINCLPRGGFVAIIE